MAVIKEDEESQGLRSSQDSIPNLKLSSLKSVDLVKHESTKTQMGNNDPSQSVDNMSIGAQSARLSSNTNSDSISERKANIVSSSTKDLLSSSDKKPKIVEENQPKHQILSQTPSLASLQKGAKILHSEDQRSSKASSSNEEAYIRKLEERIRN